VIIYPDRVQSSWWRQEGHRLAAEDLPEVLSEPPEVLVVGQGSPGLMAVPPETRSHLEEAGIQVIVEPTAQAWQTYNRLRQEKRVVAALHLTC
ncbi:MAG: MTH938/NDUFAF3 family protein, partial [Anaerolineae bacterium]|nr:MTH938/NDUFAF3 family protein [Anaerolineae bacterium]